MNQVTEASVEHRGPPGLNLCPLRDEYCPSAASESKAYWLGDILCRILTLVEYL